ncbi:LOW QUALITY PROTEIN: YLP motif-containing protein 1-like [Pecten maximus]|uniref:LOW QUALITY PROTEIN: YLP motif-containing protein 1-like n=1 Tax=Pecten maximus TaxID=6579 RepID=UPI001459071D|nr:LOW QUALITY PROTEIN: YLP motif-containing protein 1-like [Pecten maximus]
MPSENVQNVNEATVQLTALPRERLWRYPFYIMDGEFTVEYLGCSTLSKSTTSGLGSIQKPLREKYIEFRKASSKNKKLSQEAVLRINRDGLTVLFPGAPPGQANQMFYDFQSINLFEAVRFMYRKGTDKKMAAGFVPIEQNRNLNNGAENLFSHLDKKNHNLLKMEHPVMLAGVMRRTTGVRALECHCFIAEHDGQALRVVSMLRGQNPTGFEREPSFQNRYGEYSGPNPGGPHPDILRNSYGEYGAYRNEPPMGPGPDQPRPHSDIYYRDSRRSDGWEEPGRRISDEPPIEDRYLGDGRQFFGGPPRDMGPPPRDMGPPPRDMGPPPRDMGPPPRDMGPPTRNRLSGEDRHFLHERQSSGDSGSRGYPEPHRADNGFIHERQRSGEIVRGDRHSDYGGEITRSDRHSDHGHGERFSRPQTRDDGRVGRVMSPGRYREPPSTAPKPSRALSPGPRSPRSPPSSRHQGLPRQPFDSPPSPTPSKPLPRTEPVYSASNLESRQLEEKQAAKVKPVAKVPPNHVMGVKVLPTGLMAALPKKVEAEPSRYNDDDEDPYDNAMSRKEFYDEKRNTKSDQDKWDYRRDDDFQKPGPGGYAPPDIVPRHDRDPRYGDDYGEMYRDRSSQHKNNSDKSWSFDSEFQKYAKHASDDSNSDKGSYGHSSDRKGGELAGMFHNMNVQRGSNDRAKTSDTNFEQQLGYLP